MRALLFFFIPVILIAYPITIHFEEEANATRYEVEWLDSSGKAIRSTKVKNSPVKEDISQGETKFHIRSIDRFDRPGEWGIVYEIPVPKVAQTASGETTTATVINTTTDSTQSQAKADSGTNQNSVTSTTTQQQTTNNNTTNSANTVSEKTATNSSNTSQPVSITQPKLQGEDKLFHVVYTHNQGPVHYLLPEDLSPENFPASGKRTYKLAGPSSNPASLAEVSEERWKTGSFQQPLDFDRQGYYRLVVLDGEKTIFDRIVGIDRTPPKVKFAVYTPYIYEQPLTILSVSSRPEITAHDAHSGVKEIYFHFRRPDSEESNFQPWDPKNWYQSAPKTEEELLLEYYAVDFAGNQSKMKKLTLIVDLVPPRVKNVSWDNQKFKATLEEVSFPIEYTIEAPGVSRKGQTELFIPTTTLPEGTNQIRLQLKDGSGNETSREINRP